MDMLLFTRHPGDVKIYSDETGRNIVICQYKQLKTVNMIHYVVSKNRIKANNNWHDKERDPLYFLHDDEEE